MSDAEGLEERRLTDEELKTLADSLSGTSNNVYTACAHLFNVDFQEAQWKRLEKIGGLFKCEDCEQWQSLSKRDKEIDYACTDCIRDW